MDSGESAVHRGPPAAAAVHPSSPIDVYTDLTHLRPHPSSGNLSLSGGRKPASPHPGGTMQQQQQQLEMVPDEEELDPFDIVLQQDAAAGPHSPQNSTPITGGGGAGVVGGGSGSQSVHARSSHLPGPHPGASKQLPSVAGACQASALTQNREQCAWLIHQMATAFRGQLQLQGQNVVPIGATTNAVPGASLTAGPAIGSPSVMTPPSASGSPASTAPAAAASVSGGGVAPATNPATTLQASATAVAQAAAAASPGGDPRATTSSGAQSAALSAAAAAALSGGASSFEAELSLLTDIILEANFAHNPQWTANLQRGSGVSSPRGWSSTAAAAPATAVVGGLSGHGGVSRGASPPIAPAVTHVAPSAMPRAHSRGSPGGPSMAVPAPTPHGSPMHYPHTVVVMNSSNCNYNGNDGRSTIDTEVSDSLGRISCLGGGGGAHHHLYMMEHEVRPGNPCQGGNTVMPRQAPPPSIAPSPSATSASGAEPWSTLMCGNANVGHLDRAAITNLNSQQQQSRRGSGSAARSTSATVKHPRAVKPDPQEGLPKSGHIRGPRSRTGKNVAPSNHSAFSECSGGETRSCRSTLTGVHRVLSSSANATTNTSLSSCVFNHIQGAHVVGGVAADRRE